MVANPVTNPAPTPQAVQILPIGGVPEIHPGDDLAALLLEAAQKGGLAPAAEDVLVVAQKIISKAEARGVPLASLEPSPLARQWAATWERDARMVELVLREARRIVRMERGIIITETAHGFICANAGIDLSNSSGEDIALLLPEDCDRSARQLREGIAAKTGLAPGVIIADSFGRPWRSGLTQVALGVAGLAPLIDLRGDPDGVGRPLHVTIIAIADELASAADLVCGKLNRVPAAIIRGFDFSKNHDAQNAGGQALLRNPEHDLFR